MNQKIGFVLALGLSTFLVWLACFISFHDQIQQLLMSEQWQKEEIATLRQAGDRAKAEKAALLEQLRGLLDEIKAAEFASQLPAVSLPPVAVAEIVADSSAPTTEAGIAAGPVISEDERQHWEERRHFGQRRMRERLTQILEGEMNRTNDPTVWERLAEIRDCTNHNLDLYLALRASASDEEREKIRQELAANQSYIDELRQEQRDYMLREIAKQHGLTDPVKQTEFVNATLAVVNSPLFLGHYSGFSGWPRQLSRGDSVDQSPGD